MQVLLTLLFVPLIQVVVAAIAAIPTWLLWNWIAVTVFAMPSVSLLQTLGLLLLCSFLFGGRITIERS